MKLALFLGLLMALIALAPSLILAIIIFGGSP